MDTIAEKMSTPLVSVIMATYNEPKEYIEQAIKSILTQTYRNFELIILDDSTNKDTRDAIDNLKSSDKRVVVIRKDQRMGFVHALNEGLRLANGEFIARMDGDDISLPTRLEIQVKYLSENLDVDILGGGMNIIDELGNQISERAYPSKGLKLHLFSIFRNPLAHPTVMIRKSRLGDFRYDESFNKAEDLELWMRLRNRGAQINNLYDKLINYRVINNMGNKRNNSNFKASFRARKKNFNVNFIIFDTISIIMSFIYSIIPISLISFIYSLENNK